MRPARSLDARERGRASNPAARGRTGLAGAGNNLILDGLAHLQRAAEALRAAGLPPAQQTNNHFSRRAVPPRAARTDRPMPDGGRRPLAAEAGGSGLVGALRALVQMLGSPSVTAGRSAIRTQTSYSRRIGRGAGAARGSQRVYNI